VFTQNRLSFPMFLAILDLHTDPINSTAPPLYF
jgi:hypothetical protein